MAEASGAKLFWTFYRTRDGEYRLLQLEFEHFGGAHDPQDIYISPSRTMIVQYGKNAFDDRFDAIDALLKALREEEQRIRAQADHWFKELVQEVEVMQHAQTRGLV